MRCRLRKYMWGIIEMQVVWVCVKRYMRCRQCRYMWGDKLDAGCVSICGGINEMQGV